MAGRYSLVAMSDSKHRHNVPPERNQGGTTRSSQSASSHTAAPVTHASAAAGNKHVPLNDEDNKSGRVAFDSRGNPVWQWQTAPGVYETDVTTQRLKKLEAPELTLASTQPVPTLGGNGGKNTAGNAPKTKSKDDTGFNPYDSDAPMKPRTDRTRAAHPAMVHKRPPPARRPQAQPEKPTGMWDKFKSKFT